MTDYARERLDPHHVAVRLQPRMSGDGRWVVFQNQPDFSGQGDILIRDRLARLEPELVNVPVGEPIGPRTCAAPGRVGRRTLRDVLERGPASDRRPRRNGGYDLFLRDRSAARSSA
jgi:hypothetical protein